jgi:hypothetical protein
MIRVLALLLYGSSIVAANWLIRNVGTVALPDGTHMVIPLAAALPGLLLAKLWVQLLATPVAAWLRDRLPAEG